eukprot:7384231-Prymnesium_polylepis.1
MERLWDILPSSERIVEDISALPVAISKIIAARGAVVPELDNRKGRRSVLRDTPVHPDRCGGRARHTARRDACFDPQQARGLKN